MPSVRAFRVLCVLVEAGSFARCTSSPAGRMIDFPWLRGCLDGHISPRSRRFKAEDDMALNAEGVILPGSPSGN